MSRLLYVLVVIPLFLIACLPQAVSHRQPIAVASITASPTNVATPTSLPTPTLTSTPAPPSLESLGLSSKTQALLDRQGWDIAWDGDNYLISQLAWDEASQSFTDQPTHEIGWMDIEGKLHTEVTQFSATEDPSTGQWTDTSTTQELVVDLKQLPEANEISQTDANGQPIDFAEIKKQLEAPGFHLLHTKNPAFQKTGILTLTYLDENGAPQTIFYNPELGFLPKTEISTDLLHPTPIPIEAVHSLAAHQLVLLTYGDGEPFPTENFPGWAIQFQYFPENGTKRAYLWPRSGKLTPKYIRFIGENNLNIPWFEILLPYGTGYPCAPVELFNPKTLKTHKMAMKSSSFSLLFL